MAAQTAQVAGNAASTGVGAQPTPGGAGVANPPGTVTPGQPPADARATVDWEARGKRMEADLNAFKSSTQSQAYRQQQEHEARIAALNAQLQEVATRGLTDEQKREYAAAQERRELETLRQQNVQYAQALQQQQAHSQYLAQWTQVVKVPLDQLDISSIEAMNASGWAYVTARLEGTVPPAAAGQLAPAQGAAGQPPPVVPAPEVVTDQGQTPGGATTFAALRESLKMDDEEIYRAIETGQLDKDIIPV